MHSLSKVNMETSDSICSMINDCVNGHNMAAPIEKFQGGYSPGVVEICKLIEDCDKTKESNHASIDNNNNNNSEKKKSLKLILDRKLAQLKNASDTKQTTDSLESCLLHEVIATTSKDKYMQLDAEKIISKGMTFYDFIYPICAAILITFLINSEFSWFTEFLNLMNIQAWDFFHRRLYFHFPFHELCSGGNYNACVFLLTKYSRETLNIDSQGYEQALFPRYEDVRTCENKYCHICMFFKQYIELQSRRFIKCKEQEILWCFSLKKTCKLYNGCERNKLDILTMLLKNNYLNILTLRYKTHSSPGKVIARRNCFSSTLTDSYDTNFILKKMYMYAKNYGIVYYDCVSKLCNILYNHNRTEISRILGDMVMGKCVENQLAVFDLEILIKKYKIATNCCYEYCSKTDTEYNFLYKILSKIYNNNNKQLHELSSILYASGEDINVQETPKNKVVLCNLFINYALSSSCDELKIKTIFPLIMSYISMNSLKAEDIKNRIVKDIKKTLKYVGPGESSFYGNYMPHLSIDPNAPTQIYLSINYNPPALTQIVRATIRERILKCNKRANIYNVGTKLSLPKILSNFLVYNFV